MEENRTINDSNKEERKVNKSEVIKKDDNRKEHQSQKNQTQQRRFNPKFNPKYRKKVCKFCTGIYKTIDYKEVEILKNFISERGKILPRRLTGTCAKHQRLLAKAIKRARIMALLPFVAD